VQRNESLKVARHRRDISRNQNAASLCCDLQNFLIRGAIGEHDGSTAKVDRRFPSPQSSSDFRVQVGVGLEAKAQARFTGLSLFARSKRSTMSDGRG
jgi:hypothetical protein